MIQTTQKIPRRDYSEWVFMLKIKRSYSIIAFIFVYTIRYCKGNKGSIPQSSTTPFSQNPSAKALQVSKLQDTEWDGKPDTKSPAIKL